MKTRNRGMLILTCSAMIAFVTNANASNYIFNVSSGSWNAPSSWNLNAVPGAGDTADIYGPPPGRAAIVTDLRYLSSFNCGYSAASDVGMLDIRETGDLELSNVCSIPWGSGTGTVQMAGKFVCPNIYLGNGAGMGRIVQSGGFVTASAGLYLGYEQNGRAYFEQNGGTNSFGGMQLARHVGAYGVYTINGGMLTTPALTVGSTVGGTGGQAVFTMGGSADVSATSIAVGSAHPTSKGNNRGAMNVNGGLMKTTSINIPYAPGSFGCWTQTAGVVTCPNINLAWNAGATGLFVMTSGEFRGDLMRLSYNHGAGTIGTIAMSGGLLNVTNLSLGTGTGSVCTVRLSGGTNRVVSTLSIGVNVDAVSEYAVGGGLLDATIINLGASTSSKKTTLAYSGGEIRTTSLLIHGAPLDATFRLTLPKTGLKPIQVSGSVALNNKLTIERASKYSFDPGAVVTVMTYTARSGAFSQTNFMDGMTCRVNYDVDLGGGLKAMTLDQLRPLPNGTVIIIQ